MPGSIMHPPNTIWGTQLATFGLVAHLWFDHMGDPEVGMVVGALLVFGGVLVLMNPGLKVMHDSLRGDSA